MLALTTHAVVVDFDPAARVWAQFFAATHRAGLAIPATILPLLQRPSTWTTVLVGPTDEHHFRAIEGMQVRTFDL